MKLLILAGGSGVRLWPLSRISKPKQIQPFLDSATLLQRTWRRLRQGFKAQDIFISTTQIHLKEIKRQLPQLLSKNIIIEPQARNTAPAIGLAALVINKVFPKEIVATVNSDHYIGDNKAYIKALKSSEQSVRMFPENLLLLGIKPIYPEIGYGYIKLGPKLKNKNGINLFKVGYFTEKPSPALAQTYVKGKNYLWNSGLFIFYPKSLLQLYKKYAPQLERGINNLVLARGVNGEWRVNNKAFGKLNSISIDYAVIEKADKLMVLPSDFNWTDVGHWRTMYDISSKDANHNVIKGDYLGLASKNNLVYSLGNKLIATVGVNDFVIIDAGDALLICPKAEAQNVKLIVAKLKNKGLKKYL